MSCGRHPTSAPFAVLTLHTPPPQAVATLPDSVRQSRWYGFSYGDVSRDQLSNCHVLSLGRPRSIDLHPRGQSCPFATIPRDAQVARRSPSCFVSQACRQRHTTYDRRTGQCSLCLPTSGRAIHGAHHQPPIQHPPGHRLAASLCPSRLHHVQELG